MAKLRTQEVERLLHKYPLYSQDGKDAEALVLCKFFIGSATWYIMEGSEEGGDFTLFGLTCMGQDAEFGYTSLSELESIAIETDIMDERTKQSKGTMIFEVERDISFEPVTLKELAKIDDLVEGKLRLMGYI